MNDDQARDAHRDQREQLGAFALGLLPATEAARISGHLRSCGECRHEVAELRRLGDALRHIDPDRVASAPEAPPELTPALERAIAERLANDPALGGPARERTAPVSAVRRLRPRRRVAAMALVAAALVVIAGASGYQLGRPTPPPIEAVAITQPAAGPVVTAGVIPHTWGMEIRLDAVGFVTGERYVVTVIDQAGTRYDAGEFIGTGTAPMDCSLNSSVLRSDAVGFEVSDAQDRVVLASTF